MKVIVPINEEKLTSGISVSFGRAPFFMIWNTETQSASFVENPGASSNAGAGIKAAQAVVDEKADAIIVPRLGKNAADVLDASNIKIYKPKTMNTVEMIQAAVEEKLEILTDIHPGFHGHGV